MKKLLLSLLAFGMFVNTLAQRETEKWVITPVSTMKGVLGRLDINFPPDVYGDIQIYYQADNKWFTSVSGKSKSYSLAPGVYRFELSSAPVENVPIQKGHETRLKAGFLSVVSEGSWHLYNEAKEKIYASGNTPYKIVLPVGSYQLSLGGQFYPVVIKDGETVEDSSPVEVKDKTPVEVKDKTPVEVKNETPGNEKLQIIGTNPQIAHTFNAYWVLSPLESIPDGKGRLNIFIPKNDTTMYIIDKWIIIPRPIQSKIWIMGYDEVSLPKVFSPQTLSVRLNNFLVKDVPINEGKETRLKAGFLTITAKHDIYLESEEVEILADLGYSSQPSEDALWTWELKRNDGTSEKITGKKRKIYALPPGVYILKKTHPLGGAPIRYTVTIKDGQRVTNGVKQ